MLDDIGARIRVHSWQNYLKYNFQTQIKFIFANTFIN
jgi:hypothetical protein